MRTWRVGTISMGLTLVFLGVFLVLSQLFNWKPAYAMTGWWPLILIVLGVEVLLYLFLAKQENPAVKYDVFSILFVGFIGFVGIGFATVQATGILDKMHDWTNHEIKTMDLPTYSEEIGKTIKRVVVHTGSEPLTIETGTTGEFSVFGTYEAAVIDGKAPIEATEDYLFTETQGDTLYVTVKSLPETLNPFGHYRERNTTMIIPDHVEVDIDADYQRLSVHSRTLKNDWTIENASEVNVQLAKDIDVKLEAEKIDHFNEHDGWKVRESIDEDEHEYSGTRQLGKGTHSMRVVNASNLSVTTK